MDNLNLIRQAIAEYAKPALTGEASYLTQSDDGKLFSVVDVYQAQGKHYADTGLVVRIEGKYVIIEHDMNNKPPVDALVQVGIPRSQLVLAYAGEPCTTESVACYKSKAVRTDVN
jgi:hypothetical protein